MRRHETVDMRVYSLVGQDDRELQSVTGVQLVKDGLAPANELVMAVTALEILRCQVVVSVDVQDLAHRGVCSSRGHFSSITLLPRTHQLDGPDLPWHPHQDLAGEVLRGLGWLSMSELGLRRVEPELRDHGHVHLGFTPGRLPEEGLGDPPLVSFWQGFLPSFCQEDSCIVEKKKCNASTSSLASTQS